MNAINWASLRDIGLSWIISPGLAGISSGLLYITLKYSVLRKQDAFMAGLRQIPLIYGGCLAVNVALMTYQILRLTSYNDPDTKQVYLPVISVAAGIVTALVTFGLSKKWLVPWLNRHVERKVVQVYQPLAATSPIQTDQNMNASAFLSTRSPDLNGDPPLQQPESSTAAMINCTLNLN